MIFIRKHITKVFTGGQIIRCLCSEESIDGWTKGLQAWRDGWAAQKDTYWENDMKFNFGYIADWFSGRTNLVLEKRITCEDLTTEMYNYLKTKGLERDFDYLKYFIEQKITPIIAEMKDESEIWLFDSRKDAWRKFRGRLGIAIVRKGKIIDTLTFFQN